MAPAAATRPASTAAVVVVAAVAAAAVAIICASMTDAQHQYAEPPHHRLVSEWADRLGDELWRLTMSVTRAQDIKAKYKLMNASVRQKDGHALLRDIIERVGRMLKSKIVSAKCIMQKAEDLAESYDPADYENFTYHNVKHSPVNDKEPIENFEYLEKGLYEPLYLTPDSHFNYIPVNRSHSSVHVPTNVFDEGADVLEGIQWSTGLDEAFIQNMKSDPTLSWQYFGGSTGFMRIFPAMAWAQTPDLFDCRTRPWYIQAATCSKDVVILMDTTGSMTGIRFAIAKLTVHSILDTLSNNDFVNVFNFSTHVQEVVPCFKDTLVQATLENVNTFKQGLDILTLDGAANFSKVFIQAFELLEKSRQERGCGGDATGVSCNQAIMLITDSVTGNITEVFKAYNRLNNGTNIPVRVFTFLVGKEVTKVMEIIWMACLNRGFYTHIQSLNEAREQVFRYIPVIARPLVLQREVHPVVWTHADADIRDPKLEQWLWDVMENVEQREKLDKHFRNKEIYFSQREEDNTYTQAIFKKFREPDELRFQEYRLLTSVAVPAFDRRLEFDSINRTDIPSLLGVAGTDVPIPDIEKLTMPYKTGVNGYAFIVTNNGYLLLHPDLRPVSRGQLKDNYNSVDLTEIELLDNLTSNTPARELEGDILKLREEMVTHKQGEMLNVRIKYHYDDMRRVVAEARDFVYAPLAGTPFSVAVSLPAASYGRHFVSVQDIIKDLALRGRPVTAYFNGDNWKVHPNWLYCKYFNEAAHYFQSPEKQLLHFLEKMASPDFQWREQFMGDPVGQEEDYSLNSTRPVNCNRPEIGEDEYYCEKELVQMLVFDGKLTHEFFNESWTFRNTEEELIRLYNTSVKFIATHSGLTRWQYILDSEEDKDGISEFGDIHSHAVEEPWYRAAVLQHDIDPDSVVVMAPFEGDGSSVTLSHAIFPRDAGLEAPAAVAGLQIQHSALFERFMDITSQELPGFNKTDTCADDGVDCYLLDTNGYIVVSETLNHTGRFFGEVEGAIMEELMEQGVFRKLTIFDYQALCFYEVPKDNSASSIWNPMLYVHWALSQLLLTLLQLWLQPLWCAHLAHAASVDYYLDYSSEERDWESDDEMAVEAEPALPKNETETRWKACDQRTSLYLMYPHNLLQDEGFQFTPSHCARPFYPRLVPHTNLLLVAVKGFYSSCYRRLTTTHKNVNYSGLEHPCQKLPLNELPRNRFSACFTEHPLEKPQHMCGGAGSTHLHQWLLFGGGVSVVLLRMLAL